MYDATPRTVPARSRERASYDADLIHSVLDEALVCHLSFVVDGQPRVLPTLHVRIGDSLFVHGSTGARAMLLAGADGLPVCVAVTLLDGLVLARSQFHHSVNYRSVVAHGIARPVHDAEVKLTVLRALVDKIATGRAAATRPPSPRELAQTAVLGLRLDEVSAKVRAGGVNDEPEDLDLPYWAGVVPMRLVAGDPRPDAGVSAPPPAYPWASTRVDSRGSASDRVQICEVRPGANPG